MKRLRVGVIYGGRSGEHEVSLASAAAVIANLDRTKYDPLAIRIEKSGTWVLADRPPTADSAAEAIQQAQLQSPPAARAGREAYFVPRPGDENLISIEPTGGGSADANRALVTGLGLDLVFPVLHGPYGEDGTVQGLLELANLPYVGAGVLASAVGMDKIVMKVLFAARQLPIVDYAVVRRREWEGNRPEIARRVASALSFPVFVKPSNLGSSVGVSKAKTRQELDAAVELALEFDRKIVIEAAVTAAREIECAVLGNDEPEASVPGEIIPSREFYDYEAKYLDSASRLVIPAALTGEQASEIQRLAIEAFLAIEGAGMARIDFLLAGATGRIYVNEVNTIPGFTTISMYPKLWAASGLAYPALLDRLIQLALERHAEKQQLRTSVT